VAAVRRATVSGSDHGGCVVVADRDPDTRALVSRLLERAGLTALQATSGDEALTLVRERQPAVVLLEIALPELSGYEVCHQLRAEYGRELAIIFLSGERTEPHDRVAGLLLGADDYITKPFDPGELLARVRALARRPALSPHQEQPTALAQLTASETKVLRLLAQGLGTKEIAHQLAIAPKTVGMHIHNAMKKLGVHSRTHAVVLAHRLGLAANNPTTAPH